ncbi:MAG: flavin reductase family protein [Rhodobacteraceae bacterium]|nr:flavin reductase family protein [Paracoccaceae bacterium]
MATSFKPTGEHQRDYRNALSQFATGITVITAPTPSGGIGMTANSFASVSLDPALVLWSAAKDSLRYPIFMEATHFAIHVLREDQMDIAQAFAKDTDALSLVTPSYNAAGVPIFDTCLARFECRAEARHDAGDHTILVGAVENVLLDATAKPLIFSQRDYGTFQPV